MLDCNNMDSSIGSSLSLSATQQGYSYSYTGNLFDGEVQCEYLNFNGFELRYEADSVTQLKLYTYLGGAQDYVSGNGDNVYSC